MATKLERITKLEGLRQRVTLLTLADRIVFDSPNRKE